MLLTIWSTNVISGEAETAKKRSDSTIVVVYYFHGQNRCITCANMENWGKEVVETKFRKELEQDGLKFQPIN